MKATYLFAAGAMALTFGIAACVAGPDLRPPVIGPTAAPAQEPMVATLPADLAPPMPAEPEPVPIPPVQEPAFEYYLDAPQTPGTWTYSDEPTESLAYFALGQSTQGVRFIIRCEKTTRLLGLARASDNGFTGPRTMEIATETTRRTLTIEPLASEARLVAVELAPNDLLFDAMAITKGRFAVSVEGERTLYLPAWAEVTRVIEDCR